MYIHVLKIHVLKEKLTKIKVKVKTSKCLDS